MGESSLLRGIAVMQFLSRRPPDGALPREMIGALKIPHASLYRVLNELKEHSLVVQSAKSGCYKLGWGCVALGGLAHKFFPFRTELRRVLKAIAKRTRHFVEFTIPVSRSTLIVADTCSGDDASPDIRMFPGATFTVTDRTPHGRCFLFFDEPRRSMFQQMINNKEGSARSALLSARERALRDGYIFFYRPNGNCRVAVPVFEFTTTNRVAAALSIVAPRSVYSQQFINECASVLKSYTSRVSLLLHES